jgi:hypothetical protein
MSYMGSVFVIFVMYIFFWCVDSVSQNDFVQSRAGTEAKDALVKAVFGYAYDIPCPVSVI